MKSHIRFVSKAPSCASSSFQFKLQGVTDIIETLLLAQRQAPWKAFFPIDGATGESGTTGGDTTTDTGGGFGGVQ
ncbi:MAG: hypothetical protein L3K26_15410 [Candidatus Hydrogenedentes bacterium]|nr:hypothetical protein [Candidatus Hydrogenedentota bacterium]